MTFTTTVNVDRSDIAMKGRTPPVTIPCVKDLAREFEILLQQHVYSAAMKRVIASFNLDALQLQATETMGKHCNGCHPMGQGGYNTVFILTFEDSTDIIARLSGSHSGQDERMSPEALVRRFISEVATLRYVKKKTTIPVPEVYHAVSDSENPVGARYILMERLSGQTLTAPWNTFTSDQRRNMIASLANFQAQLLELEFPAIGCLVDEQGTVGPLGLSCTYPFVLRDDCGPFKSSKDFLLAHVNAELDLLTNHVDEWTEKRQFWANLNGGFEDLPREYAIQWFQLLLDGISALPFELLDPPENAFVLYHDDFNSGNILVSHADPTVVVGILDWEGSRVSPLWDPRRMCTVLSDSKVDDPQELASLRELEYDILTDAQPYARYSQLHLARLLHITDYGHSTQSKRSELNRLFLQWYAGVCGTGRADKIESFMGLKKFIEASEVAIQPEAPI
ncbi:kinase-like domain-containing protein [Mycena sp. CBHHK59/15]|nr:kinase-like domain-containing protein [Mycena sp. CBHHK59/15]